MRNGILLLCLVATGGCAKNKYWFNDDIDLDFDMLLAPFGAAGEDRLSTPYVSGAPVHMWVSTRHDRGFEGFSVRSTDEDVFAISGIVIGFDDPSDWALLSFDAVATGPGLSQLELVDDRGEIADSLEIDVRRPDHVELHAAGPLFVDEAFPSLVDKPQVLNGGLATFEVQYFDGDTRLFGNSVLEAISGAHTTASVDETWFFENREWLRLSPTDVGADSVALAVDGEPLAPVEINAVPPEAVIDVALFGTPEGKHDTSAVVLAQAFDAADEPIFGVEYTWDLDGEAQAGEGDLYRYTVDDGAENALSADFEGLTDEVTIHGDGFVDSSNNIGCHTAGGPPAWIAASGLLLLRRRRR